MDGSLTAVVNITGSIHVSDFVASLLVDSSENMIVDSDGNTLVTVGYGIQIEPLKGIITAVNE